MTEGSVTRTKRMGTRFFKNPPQPHMCIQDFLRGSVHPCYVNVLSWDKIAMASCPFERLPLYGGMKINPPRTERPEVAVFFVMANPEILRQNGKNATDSKEQSILIELLLDFIEAMNEGVVFMRQYKILNDRDITGELKEIWMAVQSGRAKVQNGTTVEEVKRPVPQYPQYQDQNQDQQKQQKKQQHLPQQPQYRLQNPQHPHLLQQMPQHPNPSDEKQLSQPPQYQPNYPMPARTPGIDMPDNYDLAYVRQPPNNMMQSNDRIYQSRSINTHYNVNRRERYMYRDPIVSNVPTNPQQPSAVPYPAPQYQYQQLPRPMGTYGGPSVHPSSGLACPTLSNPGIPPVINPGLAPDPQLHFDHYYLSMRLPEKRVCPKVHRMQQPEQPPIQLAHASPVPRYESVDFYNAQANAPRFESIEFYNAQAKVPSQSKVINHKPTLNFMRIFRPQVANPPPAKNSPHKRNQAGSSPHLNNTNVNTDSNFSKSNSPVKVLQRDDGASSTEGSNTCVHDHLSNDTSGKDDEESFDDKANNVQVTDLDEDESQTLSDDLDGNKKSDDVDDSWQSSDAEQINKKEEDKTKIIVMKKNKSANDVTSFTRNGKFKNRRSRKKNYKSDEGESTIHYVSQEISADSNSLNDSSKLCADEKPPTQLPESEKNGFVDEHSASDIHKESDDKIANGVSIINNSPKVNSNASTADEMMTVKQPIINGQQPNNFGNDNEIFDMYAMLRKTTDVTTQNELTNDMAQMAIKDCTDTGEIGVPS